MLPQKRRDPSDIIAVGHSQTSTRRRARVMVNLLSPKRLIRWNERGEAAWRIEDET